MNENRSEKILKSIKLAYLQQFDHPLDDHLLIQVVEKELQKKRESFLQVQLATSGLSITEMVSLRNHLVSKEEKKPKKDVLRAKESSSDEDELFEISLDDSTGFSDDESEDVKKEKRRAYARAYYHKKKAQRQAVDAKPAKKFKTTSEQRAYQRAYYQRKKAEKIALENSTLAKVAAKALEAQKQAIAKSSRRQAKDDPENLDYESLAADRLAIENAFRPSGEENAVSAYKMSDRGQADNNEADSILGSLSLGPKTKLRKAVKASSLST